MTRPADHMDPRQFLLTTPAQVAELCRTIRQEGRFAFDTEFIGEYSYTPRVWLVQVATRSALALVDPEQVDLTPIWELVTDPAIETVVFSGQQDFEICALSMSAPPANVFDLQVAAGLVGCDYPISYSRLVAENFDVMLRKKETYSDWSRRPLSRAQLAYALEDIRYLLELRDRLGTRLQERGRQEWMRQEMRLLEDAANYDPRRTASPTAVKGHKSLTSRQLAVLGELACWREQTAWSRNIPARRFAPDECLLELARRLPDSAAAILRFRGFPRPHGGDHAAEVLDAIRRGLAVPEDRCPVIINDDGDDGSGIGLLADLAVVVGHAVCDSEQLAHRLFGVRRDYDDLVRVLTGRPRCPTKNGCRLLTGWRGELTRAHLVPVLSGKVAVRVADFPNQPTIARVDQTEDM